MQHGIWNYRDFEGNEKYFLEIANMVYVYLSVVPLFREFYRYRRSVCTNVLSLFERFVFGHPLASNLPELIRTETKFIFNLSEEQIVELEKSVSDNVMDEDYKKLVKLYPDLFSMQKIKTGTSTQEYTYVLDGQTKDFIFAMRVFYEAFYQCKVQTCSKATEYTLCAKLFLFLFHCPTTVETAKVYHVMIEVLYYFIYYKPFEDDTTINRAIIDENGVEGKVKMAWLKEFRQYF